MASESQWSLQTIRDVQNASLEDNVKTRALRGWQYTIFKMVREAEKKCLRSSTGRSIKQIRLIQRNVQKQVHVARTTSIFVRAAWWEIWCKITLKEGRIYCKTQEKMNFPSLTLEDARSVFGEPWVLTLYIYIYMYICILYIPYLTSPHLTLH